MDIQSIGGGQIALLVTGIIICAVVPIAIWIIWLIKKKEKFTTILAGAATFILFAIILEKPIQNALIFPTMMGLSEHEASTFINARPVLWAFLLGLFPGVFEETGRFIAYKTVLRNRKNRETSISHGIGHGGIEQILVLLANGGLVTYLTYAVMINTGTFQLVIDQVMATAPDQVELLYEQVAQIASFSFANLGLYLVERLGFAFLYHVGASILVFYACKDKKKFWLYPFAILIHTLIDGMAGLNMAGVISLSDAALEAVLAVTGILVFFGAYFLLYRKDPENVVL
ncbi:MAG: YhfC family intramembrane metalloprotease [Lachnospiraceae bacterium]|nr:YhfC family intramembrane metalloprotease [Lachnospiraceae bacterium]